MVGPRRPFISRRGLAGALGFNLWLLAFVIPMAFSRSARSILWAIAPLAPICLVWGLRRRSPPALLLGVPVAALVALALPELDAARRYQAGFVVVAASLVAYLLSALVALEAPTEPPRRADPIGPIEPTSPRWMRRLRIYRGFALAAPVLPALLIYAIDLHHPTMAALSVSYPGEAERARTLMTCVATLLFAFSFVAWFARPLAGHLGHDIAVRVTATRSQLVARQGRLRAAFYLAVAIALGLMAALIALGMGGR